MAHERKKLLLVTAGFPFADTERGFISTEFELLRQRFDISVLCVGSREQMIHPFPETIPVERYFYPPLVDSPTGALRFTGALLCPRVWREAFTAACGVKLTVALERIKQVVAFWCDAKAIAQRMETYVQEGQADLIYTYWCTAATLGGVMVREKHPRVRVVTRFHGHDLFAERKKTGWQPFRRLIASSVDRLVFACRMGMDYFLNTWGREFADKADLRYLGCAPAEQPPKAESDVLRIVSCSNLIPLKRVDRIIDAISLLPGEVPVRWDHFGDGTERTALEQRAQHVFGEHVQWHFHGRVPNHTLPAYYNELDPDLFITTTETEGGVPVSLQEAFAMGIPAVGTAAGGVPEIVITGQTGYLLDANATAEEVSAAILAFWLLPQQEKRLLSARAFALWETEFDARRNAQRFVDELATL